MAQEVVPGQFLVKFKNVSGGPSQSQMSASLNVEVVKELPISGAHLVQTLQGDSLDHAYAKELLESGLVDYIEPNYVYTINATPNDSRFNELWGLHNTGQTGGTVDVDIDAPEAWNLSTGSSQVVVGVIDTGVNYLHPDLIQNMWVNPNEIPGNGIDDDGNGVIDDVYGFNAINSSGDPMDDHSHGSHCAGTIGGKGNNSQGVAGVNWNVKIMALKFLGASGSGSTQGAIDAIDYAIRMKNAGVNIKVLSNSWGGGGYSQALADAITAANNAGILFVAAAGNSARDTDVLPNYPSTYDVANIVSVAAIDHNGNLASFSNYGVNSVDLAAPGVSVLSTVLGSNYASYNGTSMATPHVAGVAALLLAKEPLLNAFQIKDRLLRTVKPLSTLSGLMISPGTVNAYNALSNITSPTPPSSPANSYQKSAISINYDSALGSKVLNVDDGYVTIPLDFNFYYYGELINRLTISSNGRVIPLRDGDTAPTSPDYSNVLIAGMNPYNDDLHPITDSSESGVWYKSNGSSATVTWVMTPYALRNQSGSTKEMRFQLKLNSDGIVEFHYLDTYVGSSSLDYGSSASIGLVPPSGVSGQRVLVSHNTSNQNDVGSGKALRFDQLGGKARADFDGDGKSDVAVWRPNTGYWYILYSGNNFDYSQHAAHQLGLPGDIPLVGDYDGDGRADLAVWRPSNGMWYFRHSGTQYNEITGIQWGLNGDKPLAGDFDGDGKTDIVVYRPFAGVFFALLSSNGFNRTAALTGNNQAYIAVQSFMGGGHYPVIGDFDGDGRDNFVTIWDWVRVWFVRETNGQMQYILPWGIPGDTPITCDWDGDEKADRIMVRTISGNRFNWFVATAAGPMYELNFGRLGDQPSCANDYDGDGKGDPAVYRPANGTWYVNLSASNEVRSFAFGLPGDQAL